MGFSTAISSNSTVILFVIILHNHNHTRKPLPNKKSRMKFSNIVITLSVTAGTVTSQSTRRKLQKAVAIGPDPQDFPSGFNKKKPLNFIEPIDTVFDIPPPFSDNDFFVSEYVSITDSDRIGTSFPQNLALIGAQLSQSTGGAPIFFEETSRSLLGSIFYTSGDLYNRVELVETTTINNQGSNVNQFVGGRTVSETEPGTPTDFFTFNGQCTTVSDQVKLQASRGPGKDDSFAEINGHTCLYDMCFGGIGEDCILIYSGTPFVFDIRSGELPPGFPGFVAGGTGEFFGVTGTVDILTVTGRSKIQPFDVEDLIGDATVFPAPPGSNSGSFGAQIGEITQKIFLTTNIELPIVA